MWKRVIRCSKDVSSVVTHGKQLLKIDKKQSSRRTRLENEIVKFRAALRHKKYLSSDTPYVRNTEGKRLNDSLMDFKEVLKEQQLLYFKMVREGTSLQSIRYENFHIHAIEDDFDKSDDEIGCFEGAAFESENESDFDDYDLA